jgi:MFS family permease
MSTAQALTPILAPVLGGFLHVAFGWRSVFYMLAGFGALFVLGALSLVRETNVRRDATALSPGRLAENLRALLGSPAYLGYVAAGLPHVLRPVRLHLRLVLRPHRQPRRGPKCVRLLPSRAPAPAPRGEVASRRGTSTVRSGPLSR